ncbi:MAG TPA: right-handed parallel beta-helix repeat-containing protein [Candidatus Binataceae bacterium]|nr:right-handed parallel beta-helix repeat-containing protein [Candidatus Binataceae bacterium]
MGFNHGQRRPPAARGYLTRWVLPVVASCLVLGLAGLGADAATPLCVGKGAGCFSTVQAAINAVNSTNSTIVVNPGSYTATCGGPGCAVGMISSTAANGASLSGLTLLCGNGQLAQSVVLNASGLNHALYVSGVNGVTIAGCTAAHAAREGILVENSNNANVTNNQVTLNDQAMSATIGLGTPPCPSFLSPGTPPGVIQCCPDAFAGGPGNFPNDNDDCGEGVHLRSVTNSVVQGNHVFNNIGGILLSDETGPNSNNLVSRNLSENNREFGGDCGVTLASHITCAAGSTDVTGCTLAPSTPSAGVFHNVVDSNVMQNNGASGAGLFANPGIPPGSATAAYGNVISGNIVKNNGQPGIAIHVHAANGNADNNVIVNNTVSGNGGDSEATPGGTPPGLGIELLSNGDFGNGFGAATPIVGTTIADNIVSNEDIDIWVGNTDTDANAMLNNLIGSGASGITNAGSGNVTATDNWWGCPDGPGASGCSSTSGAVTSSPFLSHPAR